MQKIKLICQINNSFANECFHLIIKDKENNKIYNCYFIKSIELDLQANNVYKIIIISPCNYNPSILYSSLYVDKNTKKIIYKFTSKILSIKIKLVDKKYQLPIEKGEIKLWQDHTQ